MKRLFNQRQTSIISAAFIIMVTYGLSSLLGLLRNRLLATFFFGEKVWQLDVYFASFVIPDAVFQLLVTGALSAAFMPVFSKYYRQKADRGWELAAAAINVLLLFFLGLSLLVFIFARPLSQLVAVGYSASQVELMTQLTRIMLFAQLFFAVSSFFTGILQTHQRFIIPAIAPIFYNLGIIGGTVLLTPRWQIYGPAAGVVFGAFLHFFIQLPFVYQLGFKYRLLFDFKHPGIKEMRRLMLPRTLALAVGQIENFLAVLLTAGLSAGSLSIFKFAKQLYLLPITLFGVTFAQAAFPTLTYQAAGKEMGQFKRTFCRSLRQIAFFSLPASVMILVLRIPLVRLAFGAKQFPWKATLLTGRILAILSLSIVAQAINQLLIRTFYALHNTKAPFLISFLSAILNVGISIILVKVFNFGVLGLAWAICLTGIFQLGLLVLFLRRRLLDLRGRGLVFSLLKMVLAAGLTAVCLWLPMRLIDRFVVDTTRISGLVFLAVVVSFIGTSVYLLTARILKIKEVEMVGRLFKRLLRFRTSMATKVVVEEASGLPPSTVS
ncbi:murein biosynthesis integral membrane protein MurJ [Patescibacteria group bacterium]|nr:murein biosynthesis integral membrane protein MurJ [Patescibacteria group bacterium]MBU1931088.1 murein biosynthesis integral membrane protein MurJ [Patescibacteria group bacterium]